MRPLDRPTIASLPTIGWRTTDAVIWPGSEAPDPIDDVPATAASGLDAEPAAPRAAAPPVVRPPVRGRVRLLVVAGGLLAAAVVVVIASAGDRHEAPVRARSTPLVHRSSPPTVDAGSVRPKAVSAPTTTPANVTVDAAGNGSVSATAPFTLTLDATGPCWVQVSTDAGQTIFEGTLQAGDSHVVTGTSALTARLGNARSVGLLLNGTRLDLSHIANTADLRVQA